MGAGLPPENTLTFKWRGSEGTAVRGGGGGEEAEVHSDW